jgi:hypothetical protein
MDRRLLHKAKVHTHLFEEMHLLVSAHVLEEMHSTAGASMLEQMRSITPYSSETVHMEEPHPIEEMCTVYPHLLRRCAW